MFIPRNFERTEHDDFVMNVQRCLDDWTEALEVKQDGAILGWILQPRFE